MRAPALPDDGITAGPCTAPPPLIGLPTKHIRYRAIPVPDALFDALELVHQV